MKSVSFDFDGVLSEERYQEYAKELISKNLDVWIHTSRFTDDDNLRPNWNKDVYDISEKLGIPKSNIVFTEMIDKYIFISNDKFIWHLDDDCIETFLLNLNTNTKGVCTFGNKDWKIMCDKYIELYGN